jgi:hypothetical protein
MLSTASTVVSPVAEFTITAVSRQEEAICVVGVIKKYPALPALAWMPLKTPVCRTERAHARS